VAGRLPIYNYRRGRLCYLTGAVYSIERADHAQAMAWFDRAARLLEKPVPAAAIDAGAQGEAFVSMAVSYWEENSRREALRLTRQGLKLMERAVGDGNLDTASLAIPYGNLASMHEALGEFDEAQKCAELANRYESNAEKK
jgi:tetratricopeptide (TPR) repeat protein